MLEDYQIEKKIGSGTFGDVFIGKDKNTGEKVAIKRLNKKTLYQYGTYLINAFWKELDSMKRCNCENSVRLINHFESMNNYNIIMELCDSDLLIYLNNRKSPFTVQEVKETFQQLNNVFKIMHKNNIVHRDLKLGNILIKYTDSSKTKFIPKLSDYGFSKDLNDSNTDTHLGTPATMAPEIMMGKAYDDKVDLWSIGVMMYQLHYNQIPYPGFNEKLILQKIKSNASRKHPNDPQFKDLLDRLLVMDPQKRISWDDYFNHPFFAKEEKGEKTKKQKYTKISDFDLGYNFNKDMFECFIAKNNENNNQVLIKSYDEQVFNTNYQLFGEEIALFNCFKGNQSVLKLIDFYKESNRIYIVFDYIDCQMLSNYAKSKDEITEKEIKKMNKSLYDNLFIFNDMSFMPFIFISLHSFVIDKKGNPIVFDFGVHKLFISKEEYSSYFLSNESEMINSKNRTKTNVMNYGIVLLKLICGNNLSIKGKEIILPPDKILPNVFSNFISKCLARDIKKRSSWLQLGDDEFIVNDNSEMSNIIGNSVLIDNDKLDLIFDSLETKFDFLIKYFDKLKLKKDSQYLEQIDQFVVITLFEMKIIYNLFNRNIYKNPFNSQHEINFLSIDNDCKIKNCYLNLANPLLSDTRIIDMNNNKLITNFVSKLNSKIKKMEKISKKVSALCKNSVMKGNVNQFLQNLISNIENYKMQEYFFSVNKKAEEAKKEEESYNEFCLAEYLCEFFLFVKTIIFNNENKIQFTKKALIKRFYDVFGEDKNKIEITAINLNKTKEKYVLVSFIATLFKYNKGNNAFNQGQLEKNKQSVNGIIRYYPSLMQKIVELKRKIKK